MRSFAEKSDANRQSTSCKSGVIRRAHFANSCSAKSHSNPRQISDDHVGSSYTGHDFSRIPIYAPELGRSQTGQTKGQIGAGGKTGFWQTEGPPWVVAGGNGGPMPPVDAGVPTDVGVPTDAGSPPSMGVPKDEAVPAYAGSAASLPKLTKKSVPPGATASDCGGYKWIVQWELDKKTTKGGWVVQKMELPHDVKDCDGKAVDPAKVGGLKPSWHPYWEAWPIHKNQKVTTYAEGGDVEDDTFSQPGLGDDTKGTMTQQGTAEFYEGLTLPEDFKVTNKPPAWILPMTTTAPTLSGGTGSITHSLQATWDCCSKDKAATKKTTVAPT